LNIFKTNIGEHLIALGEEIFLFHQVDLPAGEHGGQANVLAALADSK